MINRTKRQTGDTIVEVMISIAIVALAIAVAYAISGKNLNVGITARERTSAVGLVQGQIERLKVAAQADPSILTRSKNSSLHFCIDASNAPQTDNTVSPLSTTLGPPDNDGGNYIPACKSPDGNYYLDITYIPPNPNPDPTKSSGNSLMFTARWFRAGGGADQIVTIFYRPW